MTPWARLGHRRTCPDRADTLRFASIENRRHICSGGLVVEAHSHQRHLEDELQLGLQAPFKDLVVARWQHEAGPAKFGGGGGGGGGKKGRGAGGGGGGGGEGGTRAWSRIVNRREEGEAVEKVLWAGL